MGSRKTWGGVENVYAAAEKWVECALRSDDSLFTPGKPIWTRQLLGELHRRFLDRPDAGEGSFLEKLRVQLEDSPPEVYQLMGEVLYVHYLIVWHGAIRPRIQKDRIDQVLGWSSQPVAIPSDLVNSLEIGIAHPGIAFGTFRPYQVGAIIEFVEQWKDKESNERDLLLEAPWSFKDFLTSMRYRSHLLRNNQNTPRIQRHALLHIVFPDTFEGTVSADQKSSIANASAFARFVTEATDDVDRKIQQIRNGLEADIGRDFDFYDPVIQVRWDTNFNPWEEFVRRAQEYIDSGRLEAEEINYKVEIGQKLADARKAMFAGSGDWARQVDAALPSGNIIHHIPKSNFGNWLRISPDESLRAFQAIWARDDLSVTERIRSFNRWFPHSALGVGTGSGTRMNVISVLLMGLDVQQHPPFAYRFFMNSYQRTGYDRPDGDADEATLYEHALGFLDRFTEVAAEHGLNLRHRLDAQSIVWKFVNELPPLSSADVRPSQRSQTPTLHSLARELTLPVEFLEEIETLLKDKKQVIFQGPPGTGKTFVAQKLANHLAGPEGSVTLVQFHPSYSYEDFVQGFRPTILDSGQPGFKLTDGPLIRAAKNAEETDAKHFLIIDEINRGNLARILGELYFLLEYRDEEISLQYQGDTEEKFSLPENLYIIGTMNTADRSIALVDLALRRRFYFVEFHPDYEPVKSVLRRWLEANAPRMARVADVVDLANQKLRDDRHAAIGPSYFMKPNLDGAAVERIWKHSVLPYIEERLFGEDDRIREFDLSTLRQEIGRGDTSANGEQPEGQDGGE